MADNKDFLSQFSEKDKPKKPDSFKEEVRIPVSKPKKEVKPVFFIIPVIILLVVGAVLFYVFGLPHIPVEDFIGKTQSDVAKWATQNEIDKTGIIFNEEYSLDFDNVVGQEFLSEPRIPIDTLINDMRIKRQWLPLSFHNPHLLVEVET